MTEEKDKDVKEYNLEADSELRFEIETKNEKVVVEVRLICFVFYFYKTFIKKILVISSFS